MIWPQRLVHTARTRGAQRFADNAPSGDRHDTGLGAYATRYGSNTTPVTARIARGCAIALIGLAVCVCQGRSQDVTKNRLHFKSTSIAIACKGFMSGRLHDSVDCVRATRVSALARIPGHGN